MLSPFYKTKETKIVTTNDKITYLAWLVEKRKNLIERYPLKCNRVLWDRIWDSYKRSKFECDLPIGKGNRWKRRLEQKRLEKWRIDYAKSQKRIADLELEYNR